MSSRAWKVLPAVICLAGIAAALSGCLTASQSPNSSGLTVQQQLMYDYLLGQGVEKNKAMLVAVNPIAQQLYFDDKTCLSYGAAPGSDAYVACRTQLEVSHKRAAPLR